MRNLCAMVLSLLLSAWVGQNPGPSVTGANRGVSGGGGMFTYVADSHVEITTSGSTITVDPGSGDALYMLIHFRTSAADTASSLSGGCSSTWTRGARSTNSTANRSQEIWYCTSATAGSHTVAVNYTTSGDTVDVTQVDVHSTASIVFDNGAGSTNLSSPAGTFTGTSITTSGNGVVLAYYTGSTSSCDPATIGGVTASDYPHDSNVNYAAVSFGVSTGSIAERCTTVADTKVNNSIVAFK